MPFADKFRAMMNFPLPGDTVGAFLVESVDVGHESGGPGIYSLPSAWYYGGRAVSKASNRRSSRYSPRTALPFPAMATPISYGSAGPRSRTWATAATQ